MMKKLSVLCIFAVVMNATITLALDVPTELRPIAQKGGFVFSGDQVVSGSGKSRFIRLSEKLPLSQLKKRFPSYAVRATSGEDCLVCVTVASKSEHIEINYDQNASVILGISSYDKRARDIFGNFVGSSLRKAVGANTAKCDVGEVTICESSVMKGLSYIVAEDESCAIHKDEQAELSLIPSCAVVSGFWISNRK
jgi:hypothetical protein